jgi:uncharacterized protein YjeT (DUF2065 family)
MNQKRNLVFLRSVLLAGGILALVYGLAFVLIPQTMVSMVGENDPVYSGFLQWPGGVLVAIGIGTLMVFRKPQNQRIFVITLAMVTLFASLALSYSLFYIDDKYLFNAIPVFLLLLISILLWISQWKSRDYLGGFR